jgi:GWxTD domain-containing protein
LATPRLSQQRGGFHISMRHRVYTLLALIVSAGLFASHPTLGQTRSAALDNASDAEDAAARARLNHPNFDWLAQDVPYIISPEERIAFVQLTSDEDRDLFIEQFWQRRNPDPDSQDNTFKSEHYRRIVYSNEHFSTERTPGWATDRGRIYIQWGQPDEVESNKPDAGGRVEIWRYRYLEGMGENIAVGFADPDLNVGYRLEFPPHPEKNRFKADAVNDTSTLACTECIQTLSTPQAEAESLFTPRFKELEAAIVARADLDDVPFSYHFDSIPATPFTTLVSLSIEIPSFEFQTRHGKPDQAIQLQLFLRITDSMGRIVETFEDWVPSITALPEAQASERPFILQKSIALRPGSYIAAIAVGNPELRTIGTSYSQLAVSPISNQK